VLALAIRNHWEIRNLDKTEQHPTETEIEDLAFGKLKTLDSLRVQTHLFSCEPCLKYLLKVELVLASAGLLDSQPPAADKRKPLYVVHDTADGMIYLKAEKQGRKWIARQWGPQLEGMRECRTMREANEHLVASFGQMFPEHRCTDRCSCL
jgi:hypothetical protein